MILVVILAVGVLIMMMCAIGDLYDRIDELERRLPDEEDEP